MNSKQTALLAHDLLEQQLNERLITPSVFLRKQRELAKATKLLLEYEKQLKPVVIREFNP